MSKLNIQKKILLFLYFIIFINSKKIIFPFKEKELNKTIISNNDLNTFYDQIYLNNLYTKLKIANTEQIIISTFNSDKTNLMLKNIKDLYNIEGHNTYNPSNSETFKNITYQNNEIISNGYSLINETIKLYETTDKMINVNNFQLELFNKYNLNNENQTLSFEIGLKNDKNKISFIEQLLNQNIISSNIISIDYTSENEGTVYLGEYPEKYNNAQKTTKNMSNIDDDSAFQIEMDYVYIKYNTGRTFFSDINILFYFEQGIILASNGYEKAIKNVYFNDKIQKGLCTENQIRFDINDYDVIKCSGEITLEDFPPLNFEVDDLTFILDHNDLFKKIDNVYYFLIVFSSEIKNWVVGKPFLQKYKLAIDNSKNTITFFTLTNNDNNNENNNSNGSNSNVFVIVLVIFIVIIVLGIILFFFIKIKRKNNLKSSDIDSLKGPLSA